MVFKTLLIIENHHEKATLFKKVDSWCKKGDSHLYEYDKTEALHNEGKGQWMIYHSSPYCHHEWISWNIKTKHSGDDYHRKLIPPPILLPVQLSKNWVWSVV